MVVVSMLLLLLDVNLKNGSLFLIESCSSVWKVDILCFLFWIGSLGFMGLEGMMCKFLFVGGMILVDWVFLYFSNGFSNFFKGLDFFWLLVVFLILLYFFMLDESLDLIGLDFGVVYVEFNCGVVELFLKLKFLVIFLSLKLKRRLGDGCFFFLVFCLVSMFIFLEVFNENERLVLYFLGSIIMLFGIVVVYNFEFMVMVLIKLGGFMLELVLIMELVDKGCECGMMVVSFFEWGFWGENLLENLV